MNGKKNVVKFGLHAVLTLIAIYTLFPIYFLFVNSFKDQEKIVAAPMSLPAAWNFDYLENVAAQIHLPESAANTTFITVVAIMLIVLVASVTAWMMVKSKSKASNVLFLIFTAAMLIPLQSAMYPLVSLMERLGFKNTFGLILMYGGFGLSMMVSIYHGFFKSVPLSLGETAVINGASIFRLFFHIVFPLVRPITVTVAITNAMWIWDNYLFPLLIIGDSKSKTLTLGLYYAKSLSGQYGNPWELIFPTVLICVTPILVIFIFLRKSIIEGIAAGTVKE